MNDHLHQTIAHLQQKLRQQEEQAASTKRTINLLSVDAGLEPPYHDVDVVESISTIRSDQFYGRPLATVIKEYLRMRRGANLGAATVNEIYETLVRGGFKFEAKNDDNAKRGVQISLTKNQDFHRVGNAWGLTEWYPNARREQGSKRDEDDNSEALAGDEDTKVPSKGEQHEESDRAVADSPKKKRTR